MMPPAAEDAEQVSVFATCGPYVMCVAVKGSQMSLSGCHREEAVIVYPAHPLQCSSQQLVCAIDMSVSTALSCHPYCALLTPAERERV